jgi:hypothetical protein
MSQLPDADPANDTSRAQHIFLSALPKKLRNEIDGQRGGL